MSFVDLHKRVTYLFAALGFAALALGAELGPAWALLFAAGFVGSWFAEGPRIHSLAWTRMLTAVALGGFALVVVWGSFTGDFMNPGLGYAGLLQVTRLLHRRTATEHLHVVALAFLHLLAGTLLSTGLDYAVVFLGFVIVAPWMLTLTHLRAEIERKHATPDELEGPPTERLARVLASKNLATRGFLVGSSLISLPLFLVTAAFFLLFPRVGLGMFTFGHGNGAQTAGFGNTVDLAGFGTIRDDPTVVARVFPEGLGQTPPAVARIRLRGTSFDRYDGVRWTRTASAGERREGRFGPIELFTRRGRLQAQRRPVRLVVEPLEEGVVFLPDGTTAIDVNPRIESGLDVPRAVRIRPGLDVRMAEQEGIDLDYVAYVDLRADGIPERMDEAMRDRLIEVPAGLERVAALADEVVGVEEDEAAVAERLLAHLRDSGRYGYSLTLPDPGDDNPLVHFLFRSRTGHCELFATAMAVMLRARGIPARNVTGLLGGRFNTYGRYYALSQGDAHSWVEAYVDGRFVTFDPTPASREAFRPGDDALAPLRALVDALRTRWARDVVGFDMRRQIDLVLALRDRLRGLRHGPAEGRFEAIESPETIHRSGRPGALATGLVVGLVATSILALMLVGRRRRARAPRDEAERLYGALDRALAERGRARPAEHTPFEHLAALRAAGFEAAEDVAFVTAVYARARYQGIAPTDEERRAIVQSLRAVGRAPAQRLRNVPAKK